jgi:hypothetical protein
MNISNYFTTNFTFQSSDLKIKFASESLSEIKILEKLLKNYSKYSKKLNLDEYFPNFLNERQQFINDFIGFLKKSTSSKKKTTDYVYINEFQFSIYKGIIDILNSKIENFSKEYKKHKSEEEKNENFKYEYLKRKKIFFKTKAFSYVSIKKDSQIQFNDDDDDNNKINVMNSNTIEETWVSQYLPQDTTEIDQTKGLMQNVTKLMKVFSEKIHQDLERTSQIKENTEVSVKNVKDANKVMNEINTKERSYVRLLSFVFIMLGLFLLLADYQL